MITMNVTQSDEWQVRESGLYKQILYGCGESVSLSQIPGTTISSRKGLTARTRSFVRDWPFVKGKSGFVIKAL
jgi:hypothetical protein